VSHHVFVAALLAGVFATAANAEAIDPCSLVSGADMAALGVPGNAVPSHEEQPGGVRACKYQAPGAPAAASTVSIILSTAMPDRALEVRALLAKALAENTPAQLEARGEYVEGNVMCKVVSASQVEISHCLGATEQSVVGMTVSRPNPANTVMHPTAQLQFMATLLTRVGAKGG
jgi:hypothetical protein